MSIKIYQAYRVSVRDFNPFLKHIRTETLKVAAKHVRELMDALLPEKVEELVKDRFPNFPDDIRVGVDPEFVKNYLKLEYLEKLFREHHDNQYRSDVFDLQSGFSFFLLGGSFYGWPWGTFTLSDEIVLSYGKVVDYSYWNNTDRPDEISLREWGRRQKKWATIHTNGEFTYRLDYRTVDYSPGCYTSAVEIQELVLKKENKQWLDANL